MHNFDLSLWPCTACGQPLGGLWWPLYRPTRLCIQESDFIVCPHNRKHGAYNPMIARIIIIKQPAWRRALREVNRCCAAQFVHTSWPNSRQKAKLYPANNQTTKLQTRHWREAYFEFRDEIENCLLSVSCLETRTRFCPPNLEPRDEIENFVHRISGLETRSRILFPKSRNLRRDRDFSIILPKHISQKKDFSHKRSNITVQPEEEGSRDSQW